MLEYKRIPDVYKDILEIVAGRNNIKIVDLLLLYGFQKSQDIFTRAIGTGNLYLAEKLARDPNEEYNRERLLYYTVRSSSV